jgi:tetratricopeptide (TPR) repeat protein
MRARQYLVAATTDEAPEPDLKTAEDMYNHGVVLMNDGAFEAALEMFESAAKKTPDDDRIAYVRAIALALSGDEDGALEMLSTAIEANDVNRVYARNDPDLAALHDNAAFHALTEPPEDEAEDDA